MAALRLGRDRRSAARIGTTTTAGGVSDLRESVFWFGSSTIVRFPATPTHASGRFSGGLPKGAGVAAPQQFTEQSAQPLRRQLADQLAALRDAHVARLL